MTPLWTVLVLAVGIVMIAAWIGQVHRLQAALQEERRAVQEYRKIVSAMETRLSAATVASRRSDSRSRSIQERFCRMRTEFAHVLAERDYLRTQTEMTSWEQLSVGTQQTWLDRAREYLHRTYGDLVG